MIFPETRLTVIDNSGAVFVKCLHIKGYSRIRAGKSGDICFLSLSKKTSRGHALKARVYAGLLASTRKKTCYPNGFNSCFSRNGVILLRFGGKNDATLLGTRVRGPIAVKARNYLASAGSSTFRAFRFF